MGAARAEKFHGAASWHYSSISAAKPQWLIDGTLNLLVRLAFNAFVRDPGVLAEADMLKIEITSRCRAMPPEAIRQASAAAGGGRVSCLSAALREATREM